MLVSAIFLVVLSAANLDEPKQEACERVFHIWSAFVAVKVQFVENKEQSAVEKSQQREADGSQNYGLNADGKNVKRLEMLFKQGNKTYFLTACYGICSYCPFTRSKCALGREISPKRCCFSSLWLKLTHMGNHSLQTAILV